jgi:iduronate 2-sulfatase
MNIFTDDLTGRQSTKMPHRMFVSVKYDGDGSDQADYKSASKAIELLREHHDDPFFLAVGFVRPHYPMVAPRQYFEPYPWQQMQMPRTVEDDLDDIPKLGLAGTISSKNPIGQYPDNQQRMWSAYYASVAFMDRQVGRVIDELDRLGLRDKTAIVFTSDHGYHLGEHGFWQKSNLHEEVLRVPLILSVPGVDSGRSESIVELVDLYPTLSELAGLPIPDAVQGTSLIPILKDHRAVVKPGALSFNKGHSLRAPGWHYMLYNDGSEELYDMTGDPHEFVNLANSAEHAEVAGRMRETLSQRLQSAGIRDGTQVRLQKKTINRNE